MKTIKQRAKTIKSVGLVSAVIQTIAMMIIIFSPPIPTEWKLVVAFALVLSWLTIMACLIALTSIRIERMAEQIRRADDIS